MNRKNLQDIVRFLMRKVTHTEFIGSENIPPKGGIILAINHMSRVDVPILFGMPARDDVFALAATKYKQYLLFKYMIDTTESIWIERDSADFGALRAAVACVNKGQALGVAPEGTRSTMAQLAEGKPGTVLIAEKTRAPIIPVGLAGTETAVKQLMTLHRPHIVVRFGKAFTLPPMDREHRDAWLQSCNEEIMCRIAAVLPPQYHGFYAGHPRLQELLRE
jgi:1-acyl-sn-glycerol-3-phosphate acyltransferase